MPALMTSTPRSSATGSRSSPAEWSSSVYLPATMATSMSVSRTKRASMGAWFMPTP